MPDNEEPSFSFVDKRRVKSDTDEAPEEVTEPVSAELAQEVATPDESAPAKAAPAKAEPEPEGASAPPVDFVTFILSMASSAAYHMGGFQDPVSGKTSINLDLAKQTIDIISMLEEKTRGNLKEDESNLISHALYDLRMQFVEASKNPQTPQVPQTPRGS